MPEAAPRVDRRRIRTRAALLSAARALFAERSVDGVNIDEIVAAADVAKGSFYNHFPDKAALAAELAAEIRAAVEARVADLNAGVDDPARQVARAVCFFVRQAAEHPEPAAAMLRLFPGATVPDAPMDRGVRAAVQAGLAEGRFRGLPLEPAVLMAVGVVQIGVSRTLQRPGDARRLAEALAQGLLQGLGASAPEAVAASAAADVFGLHRG
ncbi:TetR/AcrR family transcriptional regulator [Phenylobacterium sp. J367]|uniref:TetR/AcrR family transcriptional regulator n=1 Tax=Phenylobacterium sp. J367 TaxID=2898435 RepID=UPI002151D63E|nr:TetR/AcrR family transcriptional regulator [Phenylobacterium sp. J367]MCR5878149.1 TetR/AcrR family transcriptional regulator [Phenylobacterium sp. J367]